MKLTTAKIKEYILNLIDNNETIKIELENHELDKVKLSSLVRTHKSKIKSVHDLPFEPNDPLWAELAEDGWMSPIKDPLSLVGGVLRYIQVKDEGGEVYDAVFVIVSDKKDEEILLWSFNID
jgi:hypothetical protein